MEKYTLHISRDVLNRVQECASEHIENDKWFTVEALGDLMEVDLSDIFGNGNLGWSPTTLLHHCQVTVTAVDAALSVPKPEELPIHHIVRTVRDHMEYLASQERPTLKDWLNNSGIHNNASIGTRIEKCENESLDAIDALTHAVRFAVKHKVGEPDPRAIESTVDENVKDESRDIFVTINSDHVNPQTMHEVAKLIAVLSDTDRDIHVNII